MERRFSSSASKVAFAVALALAVSGDASAHRTDEYLQATRIGIEPDEVHVYMDLTPGIETAPAWIAGIDDDGDGRLSAGEEQAYLDEVLGDLGIELDGRPLALRLVSFDFPQPSTFRPGEGTLRLTLQAPAPGMSAGTHWVVFANGHRDVESVYLANALVPDSSRVRVTAQRRNSDQSTLTIDYALHPATRSRLASIMVVTLAATVLTVCFACRRPGAPGSRTGEADRRPKRRQLRTSENLHEIYFRTDRTDEE